MPSRHWLYFGGFLVTGMLAVGAVLVGLLDALSRLSAGVVSQEEFILVAMVTQAAEWLLVSIGLGVLALVFLVATVVSVLRNSALPRDDRLVTLVEWLERRYPLLRRFDVSSKVEPTVEDRKQDLKEQYIAGEISEREFERRLEAIMDDESGERHSRSSDTSATTIDIEDNS